MPYAINVFITVPNTPIDIVYSTASNAPVQSTGGKTTTGM